MSHLQVAVVCLGTVLAGAGRLDSAILPLLTLLAMSAFVPVWEIAQVGRQLADTLGAARRVYAVHAEPVPVTDGGGIGSPGAMGSAGAMVSAAGIGSAGAIDPIGAIGSEPIELIAIGSIAIVAVGDARSMTQ